MCRTSSCSDVEQSREKFLGRAALAYGGGELDKEVQAKLLLSYHKDHKNQKCGFISNNQIATEFLNGEADQGFDAAGKNQGRRKRPPRKPLPGLNQRNTRIQVVHPPGVLQQWSQYTCQC